jgi:hypothetical protein
MCIDLFGEIPVTESDIYDWVAAVAPRWLTPERSYRGYVKSWDVAGKIRAAKLRGTFDEIVKREAAPLHARLALDSII